MAETPPEDEHPEPDDLISAAVWMLRSEGIPYFEAQSMVRHMFEDAWQQHWSGGIEVEQIPN